MAKSKRAAVPEIFDTVAAWISLTLGLFLLPFSILYSLLKGE